MKKVTRGTDEMGPWEILRDAEDMVKNYPGDRLRLTGKQVLDLVEYVQASALTAALGAIEKLLDE